MASGGLPAHGLRSAFTDLLHDRVGRTLPRRVRDELVPEEGEYVVDEVAHHWVLAAVFGAEVLLGFALLLTVAGSAPRLVAVPAVVLAVDGVVRLLRQHLDRFVITNFRVFRVWGLVELHKASMPISRILDITVSVPLTGRLVGYGHFVFESAAQRQGLRAIRFIGDPDAREHTLQRVIQQSGLRLGLREDLAGGPAGAPVTAAPVTAGSVSRVSPSSPPGGRTGPRLPVAAHGRVHRRSSAARRRVGFDR